MKTISEQVAELERENTRLKALVDTIGEELHVVKIAAAKQDRFIELVAPSVTRLESFYDRITRDYVEIIDAYRAIRPKE